MKYLWIDWPFLVMSLVIDSPQISQLTRFVKQGLRKDRKQNRSVPLLSEQSCSLWNWNNSINFNLFFWNALLKPTVYVRHDTYNICRYFTNILHKDLATNSYKNTELINKWVEELISLLGCISLSVEMLNIIGEISSLFSLRFGWLTLS